MAYGGTRAPSQETYVYVLTFSTDKQFINHRQQTKRKTQQYGGGRRYYRKGRQEI
jgi:hypothetical protein